MCNIFNKRFVAGLFFLHLSSHKSKSPWPFALLLSLEDFFPLFFSHINLQRNVLFFFFFYKWQYPREICFVFLQNPQPNLERFSLKFINWAPCLRTQAVQMAKGGIYWMSLKVNLRNHDLWVKYFWCVGKAGSFVCFASSGKILWNAVFTCQDERKLNPELRRVAPTPP